MEVDAMAQHLVAVEREITPEPLASDQQRQPMRVIGPHLRVGNVIQSDPQRNGFVGLARLPAEPVCPEYLDVDLESVCKLKEQLACVSWIEGCHADFFLRLADRGRERSFAFLDPSARPVDLAGTEPALLADQQNLAAADDKAEISTFGGRPVGPVNFTDIPSLHHGSDMPPAGPRFNGIPRPFPLQTAL